MDWARLECRPVLRLTRNVTLGAWDAEEWGLASQLVNLLVLLDANLNASLLHDQILARQPLAALRGT